MIDDGPITLDDYHAMQAADDGPITLDDLAALDHPPVNDSQIDSQPIHSDAAGFASQPTPWAVSPNPVVERAPVVAGLPPTDPAAYSAYQRQQAGNRAGLAADAAAQQAITKGVPYAGRLLAGVAGAAGSRINEAAGSWRDVLRFYTGGEATGQPAGVVDPRAVDELNAMGGTVGDTVGRGIIQNAPAVAELVPIDPVGMASMFLSHPLAKAAKSMEAFAAARTQFLTELETVAGRRAAALTGNAIDDAVGGAAFGGVNAGARGENPITGAIEGGAAGAALGGVIRGVGAVAGKMRGTPSETRIIPPEYPSGVIQSAVNEMRPGAVDARSLNAQEVKAETNIGKTGPKVQTNSEAGAAAGSVGVERQGHPGDKVGDALGAVDRPSLESLAAELGVPFTRRTRDVDLRRAVEAATSRLAGVGTPLPTVTAAAPRADGSPPAEGAAYRGAAGSDSSLTPSPAEAEAASNRAGGDTTVSGAQPGKSGTRGSMDARMRSASGEPSGLPLLGSEPPAASPEAAAYPQGTKGTGSRFPDQTESQAPKGMRQADPGMPESLPGDAPPYPRAKSTTGEEGSSRSDSARSQAVEAVPSPNPTPREPVAKTVPPSTPPPVESRSAGAPISRDERITSARKAMTSADREAMGLGAMDNPGRRGWEEALDTAREKGLNKKDTALALAADVNERPRAFDDVETAGLVEAANDLKKQHAKLMEGVDTLTDRAEIFVRAAEIDRVETDFDNLTQALRKSGTEKGRALASQKLTLNADNQLVSVLNRAKVAKRGELAPAERAKFEDLTKRLEERSARVTELERQIAETQAEQAVKRHAGRKRAMAPKAREAEYVSLLDKAKKLIAEGCD